ncbi:HlyD family efflux transporter periplasmic adaptor subunit, partial [Oxalobacteraceae bacterium OM1]
GLAQRAADLARAEADLERRRRLGASGAISGEDLRHAEDAVKAARAAYDAAHQQVGAAQAQIDGTTIATHPDVLNAAAQLRDAWLAEARTRLVAPASGVIARRNVQIGQRVAPGAPLMSIVPLDRLWVTANFKESQLRSLRIGQKATVVADTYGARVVYAGRVVGQEAGTGSAFSLLPAQNATGNWIKVVQRVPVRIALDPVEVARHPLRLGLSMQVEIDTHEQSGPVLSAVGQPRQEVRTEVFAREAQAADAAVQRTLQANLGPSAGSRSNGVAMR